MYKCYDDYVSQMEYAEQKILEVLISGNHARKILKVSCKLLQLDEVVRLYVVPTPYKLIESLLLCLLACYDLWMSLSVEHLSQLLQCIFVARYFSDASICIND